MAMFYAGALMNIIMTLVAMQSMFPGPLTIIDLGIGATYQLLPTLAMFCANDMVFLPY